MDPVEERRPLTEPPANFERAVLDHLETMQKQIEVLSQMMCPVCGPPIHARNHPDKVAFQPTIEHHHDEQNGTGP